MNESEIAKQQAQNIPQPEPTTLAPVEPPKTDYTDKPTEYEIPELSIYKLMDSLGEQYTQKDTEGIEYANNIYKMTAEMIGSNDYLDVSDKVREITRVIGAQDAPNKMFRIYQWLRLEGQRKRIEREQEIVTNA